MSTTIDQDTIWAKIATFHDCMLVTKGEDALHARPMSPITRADDGLIYFITDRRTVKDDEIENDSQVCLTFTNGNLHVALSGTGAVMDDRATLERLWSKMATAFFPAGPADPNAIVIAVTPAKAEMWENSNMFITLFKVATALATGNRVDLGHTTRTTM